MASLERVTRDGRDCFRLRVAISIGGKKQSIGLGNFQETEAKTAEEYIDHLIDCFRRDRLRSVKVTKWLETIPDNLHARLAQLRLVEPRIRSEFPNTVLAFMRAYIKSRTDWKKSCNHKQSVDHLETFLGRDIPLVSLTKGSADRFHRWMMGNEDNQPDLSANTAGQHIKRCRQMMRAAIDERLIESSPFVGIKVDLRSDASKNRFVDASMAAAVLESCPDQEWRTLFALCRFGGLRCPSEALGLRWNDIQWDRGRFKVRSPKTEKQGKPERIVPLFPELLSELNVLYNVVQPGIECPVDSYVITRYRDTETNLRTSLGKIIDRAGVARWPKPFIALRASRRTELERSGKHPNHVLNDWFGHTGAVAETFYLQTTEDDFKVAIAPGPGAVGTFVGTSLGQQEPSSDITKRKNPGKTGALMVANGGLMGQEYTPLGSNQ